MNVSAFIELSEKEQCEELRSYFRSLGADIQEESPGDDYLEDLPQLIDVCDTCFKESSENDIESVLNSLVSLIIVVPLDSSSSLILAFCEKLTKAPSNRIGQICLRVLQNLFEGLSNVSPLRFDVYYSLLKVAHQTDSISQIFTDIKKLKKWFTENNVSVENSQKLLRLLHEVLLDSRQGDLASKVMIELLSTYTEDNASQARDDAHRCIVACLGDPTMFLMDHLLVLKPVRFLEGELIHDLLTIFVSEKLSAYLTFYTANKDFVQLLGLSHEQNIQKMRQLTFMQMAENKKDLPFELIQQELQLRPDEVEAFVIEVLRTKLVRAKMDQLGRRVLVSSTMHRTFGKNQWQQLREIMCRWRQNMVEVEQSLSTLINTTFDPVAALQA